MQFDWAKFNWIGSPDWSDYVMYIRSDTPYKTIHDVRGASTLPKCTAMATGTTGHYLPKLLEETIGTKFQIILGYPGGPEMIWRWSAMKRNAGRSRSPPGTAGEPDQSWRKNGFAHLLLKPDVSVTSACPSCRHFMNSWNPYKTAETERRLAEVVLASRFSAARTWSRREFFRAA